MHEDIYQPNYIHLAIQNGGVVNEINSTYANNELKIKAVEQTVMEMYKIDALRLWEKTRVREVLIPRQIACYQLWNMRVTLKSIGRYANMHHTSILSSREVVKGLMQVDREFKELVRKFDRRVQAILFTLKREMENE